MKKRWLPVMIIVLAVSLVSGCGQLLVAIGGADAVLVQAEGYLEDEKGIRYKGEGKSVISLPEAEGMSLEINVEGTYDFTFDPYAVHIDGTVKAMGQSVPVESYFVGKEAYDLEEEGQWTKSTIDKEDHIHRYDPRVALQFLQEAGEHTKMEEKEGTYILQADLSGDQIKKLMKEYYQEVIEQTKEDLGGDTDGEDLQLKNAKYKVWIDSKTFQTKKYEIKHEVKGNDLELSFELMFSENGKVEKITVPDDVKESVQ